MTKRMRTIIKHVFLAVTCFIFFCPIYIVIVDSFKTNADIFKDAFGLPVAMEWSNYSRAFLEGGIGQAFVNSLIVTTFSVGIVILFSSFISFALSRQELVGRKWIYALFVLGMAIPTHVYLLQLYKTIDGLGLTNKLMGLVVSYVAIELPFSVFVMTRFFEKIPKEIQESAIIDGCGNFRMYSKIIMPLSPTIISTVLIVNLVTTWNDMVFPMIFISTKELKTLPIALMAFKGEFISQYNMMFAGVVIASLPLILIFLCMQKQFMAGMTEGAVKG